MLAHLKKNAQLCGDKEPTRDRLGMHRNGDGRTLVPFLYTLAYRRSSPLAPDGGNGQRASSLSLEHIAIKLMC